MAVLILIVAIVLAVVGAIAILSPDRDADDHATLSSNTPSSREDEHLDEGEEAWVPHPRVHMDWVETAAHGKRFNPSIDDDPNGFDF